MAKINAHSIQQNKADGGYVVAGFTNSTTGDVVEIMGNSASFHWIIKLISTEKVLLSKWETANGWQRCDMG